jgi:cell division inhibitor SepF
MAGSVRRAFEKLGLASVDEEEWDYPEEGERLADVTPITRGGGMPGILAPAQEDLQRIVTARPRSYGEAKSVGRPYRDGVPVIMNLSDTNDADSQRMVDFAGGLTYAMHGRLERITSRVFLLSPSTIEVSEVGGDNRRRSYDGE